MRKKSRNLCEWYLANPGNYLLSGLPCAGKTAQLIAMEEVLLFNAYIDFGEIQYLPIFFEANSLNLSVDSKNILYQKVRSFFNNEVDDNAIDQMIEATVTTHRYLFLIDGINDIHGFRTDENDFIASAALSDLFSDIKTLSDKHPNVDFIITMRDMGQYKFDNYLEYAPLEVSKLTLAQAKDYLGIENASPEKDCTEREDDAYLYEFFSNPGLLSVFTTFYKENAANAINIGTKFELLLEYVSIESKKSVVVKSDTEYKKRVLSRILPLYAFKLEQLTLLPDKSSNTHIDYKPLLNESIVDIDPDIDDDGINLYMDFIASMEILKNNHSFSMDILKDYFAACYVARKNQRNCFSKNKDAVRNLVEASISALERGDKQSIGSTLYFTELVYGALLKNCEAEDIQMEDELSNFFKHYYGDESFKKAEYRFCFRLAGCFEDYKQRKWANIVAWQAYALFEDVVASESSHVRSRDLNWLYYSMNKWKSPTSADPLPLLEEAKRILDEEKEKRELSDKEKITYAAILSNFGSHYTSQYAENFLEAKKWHHIALNYRKQNNSNLLPSYRTLISDCYNLGKDMREENMCYLLEGFYYYCRTVRLVTKANSLNDSSSSDLDVGTNPSINIEFADILVRFLGSEMLIISCSTFFVEDFIEIICNEIPLQLQIVYEFAYVKSGRRKYYDLMNMLQEKIDGLLQLEIPSQLRESIESFNREYMKRM